MTLQPYQCHPHQAVISVDLRTQTIPAGPAAEQEFAAFLETLAQEEGVTIETRGLVRTQPEFLIRQFCMPSKQWRRARTTDPAHDSVRWHDAQMMARICPTAMIFVRALGASAHNPREFTQARHPSSLCRCAPTHDAALAAI